MRICREFENWRNLRTLSGKFLRQKSCYPESFRFLWLCLYYALRALLFDYYLCTCKLSLTSTWFRSSVLLQLMLLGASSSWLLNWLKTFFLLDFPLSTSHSYKWTSRVNICENNACFHHLQDYTWIGFIWWVTALRLSIRWRIWWNLFWLNFEWRPGHWSMLLRFSTFCLSHQPSTSFHHPPDIHCSALWVEVWSISAGLCSNCLKVPQRWSMEARSQF